MLVKGATGVGTSADTGLILGLRPANERRRYFVRRLSLAEREPKILFCDRYLEVNRVHPYLKAYHKAIHFSYDDYQAVLNY